MLSVRYDALSRLSHSVLAVARSLKITGQHCDTGFRTVTRTCKKQGLEPHIR